MSTVYMNHRGLRNFWPNKESLFNAWYLTGYVPNRPIDLEVESNSKDPSFARMSPLPTSWDEAYQLLVNLKHPHAAPAPWHFKAAQRLRISFRYLSALQFIYSFRTDRQLDLPDIVWPATFEGAVGLSKRRYLLRGPSERRIVSAQGSRRSISLLLSEFAEYDYDKKGYQVRPSELKLFPHQLMMIADLE